MLVNHRGVTAVIFHADRVLILLDDHARMGRITAAVQVGRVTAMELFICCSAVVVFSRNTPGSIRPSGTIRQPQIHAPVEHFLLTVFRIVVAFFVKAVPNNTFQSRLSCIQTQVHSRVNALIKGMDGPRLSGHVAFDVHILIAGAGHVAAAVFHHVHIHRAALGHQCAIAHLVGFVDFDLTATVQVDHAIPDIGKSAVAVHLEVYIAIHVYDSALIIFSPRAGREDGRYAVESEAFSIGSPAIVFLHGKVAIDSYNGITCRINTHAGVFLGSRRHIQIAVDGHHVLTTICCLVANVETGCTVLFNQPRVQNQFFGSNGHRSACHIVDVDDGRIFFPTFLVHRQHFAGSINDYIIFRIHHIRIFGSGQGIVCCKFIHSVRLEYAGIFIYLLRGIRPGAKITGDRRIFIVHIIHCRGIQVLPLPVRLLVGNVLQPLAGGLGCQTFRNFHLPGQVLFAVFIGGIVQLIRQLVQRTAYQILICGLSGCGV